MKIRIIPLLAGVGLLSGCAGMKADFDCTTVAHDTCMTMEQANQRVAEKTFSNDRARVPAGKPVADALPRLAPVRVSPDTARLWIAAWIDSDDVYHQPAVVSFVAAPDHWAGN